MIASLMMYATVLSILIAVAALVGERTLASAGLPRRGAWIAALLLSIALPASLAWQAHARHDAPTAGRDPIQLTDSRPAASVNEPATLVGSETRISQTLQWPALPTLDTALQILWLLATSTLALYYSAGWIRLRRALSSSDKEHVEGQSVFVSDHWGSGSVWPAPPRDHPAAMALERTDGHLPDCHRT